MNLSSRHRVAACVRGEPVDRPPAGPLAVHYCARLAGMSLKEYTLSAERVADAVVAYAREVQPDAVWVSADTWVTAEAMGAGVSFPSDDQPLGGDGTPLVQSSVDSGRIASPDVSRQGRYPLMAEATRRIREQLGDDVCIVACFDQYPFSVACALLGINRAMMAPLEEPELLKAVMQRAADYAVAYGAALAAAGADVLSGGDSPAGLLGPAMYTEVAAPSEQQVIARLEQETRRPVSLHICGDSTRLLPAMAGSGADILELDHQVDLRHAAAECGPEVALWGNLDPVGVLQQASPEEVTAATSRLLEPLRATSHTRFVASSGCTLTVDTPRENLRAFFAAVHGD